MWVEWNNMPQELQDKLASFHNGYPLIGKWHYHYTNGTKTIGLIKIINTLYPYGTKRPYMWETCGELELSRFKTQKAAEIEIYKVLQEKSKLCSI